MKSNKKSKKLEFTKETIARLSDHQLTGFQGGTGAGPDTNDSNIVGVCTVAKRTEGKASCNIFVCTK